MTATEPHEALIEVSLFHNITLSNLQRGSSGELYSGKSITSENDTGRNI